MASVNSQEVAEALENVLGAFGDFPTDVSNLIHDAYTNSAEGNALFTADVGIVSGDLLLGEGAVVGAGGGLLATVGAIAAGAGLLTSEVGAGVPLLLAGSEAISIGIETVEAGLSLATRGAALREASVETREQILAPKMVVPGFLGDQVTLSHYYPSVDAADLRNQGTATVSATAVEFPSLAALPQVHPSPPGLDTAPRSYDFTNNTITVTYPVMFGPSLPTSIDEITTALSDPALTSVTLDPSSTVPGFTQTDITSSAHVIDLNFTGIIATAGEKIVLDATFAPTASATAAVTDPVVTQSGVTISGDSSELYNVTGNDLSENIGVFNTSPVFINGNGDSLSLSGATSSFAITDNGRRSLIDLAGFAPSPGSTITLNNFQSDPTGSIMLPSQYATVAAALAALQPDGQGGSILPLTSGAALHFAGDSHLTATSFVVGHAQS